MRFRAVEGFPGGGRVGECVEDRGGGRGQQRGEVPESQVGIAVDPFQIGYGQVRETCCGAAE